MDVQDERTARVGAPGGGKFSHEGGSRASMTLYQPGTDFAAEPKIHLSDLFDPLWERQDADGFGIRGNRV